MKIFNELNEQRIVKNNLALLKLHHPETYEHSLRVAKLTIDLALENNLSLRLVKMLGKAALLHDFGKCRIDVNILSKKGALDENELKIMKQHPRLGVIALEQFINDRIVKIIMAHHEYKSSPYPRKHSERRENVRMSMRERRRLDRCMLVSQILAAADMYDALTFPRAYKPGMETSQVKNIMEKQFTGKKVLISQLTKRELDKKNY